MVQRILIADDDAEIVRLIRAYLEQDGYRALVAYDGATALHILHREHPDLVILDLALPERDGLEVTRIVRGDPSLAATPIIMLTARVEDTDKIVGLEMGADDYVTKPFNPGELMARLRAVLRRVQGEAAVPRILKVGALVVDPDHCEVQVHGHPVHLTRTEFGLLLALAQHPGNVLTRLELIEQGLGYGYEGLERSVDSHIKNLRRKLCDAGAAASLIETVFGFGYRLVIGEET